MSDWQPIETAPKDGTKILAHCIANGVSYISVIWWRGERYKDSLYKWRNSLNDSAVGGFADRLPNLGATHWMPLPDGPPMDRQAAANIVRK
jgi:hypothetical protein